MQKFKSLQELFEDEKRWTKGQPARDSKGYLRLPFDEDASCWCILGAAALVYGEGKPFRTVYAKLEKQLGAGTFISQWNDDPTRTIDDVRRLVKEAGV